MRAQRPLFTTTASCTLSIHVLGRSDTCSADVAYAAGKMLGGLETVVAGVSETAASDLPAPGAFSEEPIVLQAFIATVRLCS